ncbi:MAG: TetR/AcrR family transcriptional regulator [Actinomycetota bacterium]|nr:TetR/AcrR family transcriptional regulator [Actinomycetota bacterium]
MDTDREQLFREVANTLTSNHGASTGEIAAAANVSRATLHRVFGNRDELQAAVYGWLLTRCDEVLDSAGIDDGPVLEAFDRLAEDSYPLAQSWWLLIASPSLEKIPAIAERIEAQDQRFERFFVRGQEEGVFRPDLPPRWLAYSMGSQAMSAWFLVDDGFAGARDVPRLVRAATLEGIQARPQA